MVGTIIAQLLGTSQSGKTSLASKLGKKGTASDVVLYNQPKKSLTVIDPIRYPSSMIPPLEFLSITDVPILTLPPKPIDKHTAEMAIVLDQLKSKRPLILRTMKKSVSQPEFQQYWELARKKLNMLSHISASPVLEVDINNGNDISLVRDKILEIGQTFENKAFENESTTVIVDHSFPVKGIGTVILGRVISGQVEKGMKLIAQPLGTNVIVRSIQIQDIDTRIATLGSRVGLAIKGSFSAIKRGTVLTTGSEQIDVSERVAIREFSKAPFSRDIGELKQAMCVHGLQSFPAELAFEGTKILLRAQKPFVWLSELPVFLIDPNYPQRLLGIGRL